MKRTISWVLTLVLVLSLFAGCGAATTPSAEPTNAPAAATPTEAVVVADENLANTIEYLKAYYKNVKDGDLTPADFERLGTVRVGLDAYEVVYTVDCDESVVKIVKGDNGMVLFDVNEACEEEVAYTLTATVTGTDGKTVSMSWNHVVPAVMNSDEIVDSAYALADGEALGYEATLTGEITAVDTPYSADYKNITVTIKVAGREDKPIMCYRLKGEGADALMPGDVITVTGTLKNYKGTIEFDAGCNLDKVEKGTNSVEVPTDPQEILEAAFALDYGKSLPYPATLTGKIVGIGSKYSEQYGNVTVTIKTGEPWYLVTCFRMKGDGVDKIWLDDEITVTGNLKNYNGTIEFDTGAQLVSWIDNPDPVAPEDPAEILKAAYTKLSHRDTLPYACSLTGTVTKIVSKWSDQYGNITVNMTVPGCESMPVQCYRMNGNGAKDVSVGDTITVYGWLMNYNGTIEFKQGCTLTNLVKGEAPETNEPADGTHLTIAEAIALGETTNKIRLTGTVTEIVNTKHGNLYIQDATGSIYIYGLYDEAGNRFDAMPNPPAVGDTITVYGPVSQYKGEPQIKNAVAEGLSTSEPEAPTDPTEPETPADPEVPAVDANSPMADVLAAAEALEIGESLGFKYTLTGTLITVYDYSTQYNNITVIMAVGDTTVQCYRLVGTGADKLAVGDTVTATGVLEKNSSGYIRFAQGCTLDSWVDNTPDAEEPTEPETPELTGLAKDMDDASKLADKTYLDRVTTVTGTITNDPKASSYNEGQYNFTISAGGYTITCYYVNVTGGVPAKGDTVTVSGALTAYKGAPQFDSQSNATLN